MTRRAILLLAASCFWAVSAGAQETTDDATIDITPMVDLMQGDAKTAPPSDSPSDDTDATVGVNDGTTEVEAQARANDNGTDLAPSVESVIGVPVRAFMETEAAAEPPAAIHLPLRSLDGSNPRRLFGEYDSATFEVDIPDPAAVTGFDIIMQSSVNILPELSQIIVNVNDTEAAVTQPFAFDGFEALSVDTTALVPGTNRIDIVVRQSHRIFCGPDATFQIWTDIDAKASGVTLAPGSLTSNQQDFASVVSGLESLAVIATEPPDPALMKEISRRLGGPAAGGRPALILTSPFDAISPGPALPRIAIRSDAEGGAEIRQATDGAPVLILAPEVSPEALATFLPSPATVADVPSIATGSATKLGDFGFSDTEVRRRYSRFDVHFSLPEDWMLSANQTARINLLYRYAEGLPQSALMLVKVNGTTIRLLSLYGEPSIVLPSLPVGFGTRLLEPGVNVITFETIIPGDPPNQPCPPFEGPLAEVFADTSIVIPGSPRMAFPSVATVLRQLDPAQIRLAEGANAQGLAGAVQDALSVALVPLVDGPDTTEARLTIAGLTEVDRLQLTSLGLTRRTVEDLLTGRNVKADEPPSEDAAPPGIVDRLSRLLGDSWSFLVALGRPGDPSLADWLVGQDAVAMMLIPDPAERLDAWLIVSPGVDPSWLAGQIAAARLDPDGPKGQAALLTDTGTWINWRPSATLPALLEPVSLRNLRTIAGNYASWSPGLYVALLAGVVFVSVIVGLVFIVRTRGRRKR